jgi:hypothetical protein
MREDVMEKILRSRLREHGFSIESLAEAEFIGRHKVLCICKDTSGGVGLIGVPQTWLYFEGAICTVDQVMFLINKDVAYEWGILK